MGGFFGVTSKHDAVIDVFFGTDYHSHLGTARGGMAAWDPEIGLQREIHNISNSPFRTKFEGITDEMRGGACIGCISDTDPQPLLIRSSQGTYAICITGKINNADELAAKHLASGGHFNAMTGGKVNTTELAAAMIDKKDTIAEGIRYAQEQVDGSLTVLILRDVGELIVARDRLGRLPVLLGNNDDGWCVSLESFVFPKLGYTMAYELGPGEIVSLKPDGMKQLAEPGKKKRICAFLWTYFGYPNSTYEGVNVEVMRYRNGASMAKADMEAGIAQDIDFVSGVPDSGTPHAIGYANAGGKHFARPFIKYTPTWPRSFMPTNQAERNKVAKMKQIPVHELIEGRKLLFVDDSIVRGTQLRETVDFLYENGAKEVHMRSACPPIMYACKFLNFSTSKSEMEFIARQTAEDLEGEASREHLDEYSDGTTERGKAMRCAICKKLGFSSLEYQSLEGLLNAIGLDKDSVCTYCWTGKD
jgi:amidophosphoribosyltransferase